MEENKFDAIKPSYYNDSEISCMDAMIAAKGLEKAIAFCDCCVFKYEWRLGQKDLEEQEVGKMKWYLDKYLELRNKLKESEAKRIAHSVSRMKKEGLTKKQINDILKNDGKDS